MRGNSQRPSEAVRISFATCTCDRCVNQLCPRFGIPHQDLRLSCVNAAHHAGMLAIDRKFLIRNSSAAMADLVQAARSLNPISAVLFEQFVMIGLLLAHPHNYSE